MKKRYNVLWIMSDQHNANCTGYSGNPNVTTPNLDKIAKDGINFTNAFCNNPICAPSRISFSTGQYVHTHRFAGNDNDNITDLNPLYMPAYFRRFGYQTAHIGKEHTVKSWTKDAYEFIRFTDFCDADNHDVNSNHYFKHLLDAGLGDFYEEGDLKPVEPGHVCGAKAALLPYEHSIEHFTGEETLKFLDSRDETRPFFVHMSFQRPHEPVTPSAEHFNLYDPESIVLPESITDIYENNFAGKPERVRKLAHERVFIDKNQLKRWLASYYALIHVIDTEIGRVLQKLEEMGEADNTIIVYTSDHGDFAGEHGLVKKGISLYDSIQRIPFLLQYPGGQKGMVCNSLVESVDLYPTLCELCGIAQPEGLEGKSLLKIAAGQIYKKAVFCETKDTVSIRTKDYRLVFSSGATEAELYDHRNDPFEIHNLWSNHSYAPIKQELTEQLLSFVMQYAMNSDAKTTRALAEKNKNTPVKLLHKHGRYYSRLVKTYTEQLTWPPV